MNLCLSNLQTQETQKCGSLLQSQHSGRQGRRPAWGTQCIQGQPGTQVGLSKQNTANPQLTKEANSPTKAWAGPEKSAWASSELEMQFTTSQTMPGYLPKRTKVSATEGVHRAFPYFLQHHDQPRESAQVTKDRRQTESIWYL